jgi:hypothetical protein
MKQPYIPNIELNFRTKKSLILIALIKISQ